MESRNYVVPAFLFNLFADTERAWMRNMSEHPATQALQRSGRSRIKSTTAEYNGRSIPVGTQFLCKQGRRYRVHKDGSVRRVAL